MCALNENQVADYLRRHKIPVQSTSEWEEDMDASVDITDKVHLQMCEDGTITINKWNDTFDTMYHYDNYKPNQQMIDKIKELINLS